MASTPTRLFLFGAGASYGSLAVEPSRPPLAEGLFADLGKSYPRWAQIWSHAAAAFQISFEDGMGMLWGLGTGDPTRTHFVAGYLHDLARYFARFKIASGNVYTQLIESVERAGRFDGTVFASLNYECLLEQALASHSKVVRYFDPAPSHGNVATCWKLHGSCNFVPTQNAQLFGIAIPQDRPLGLKLKAIDHSEVDAYCDTHQGHPSAFDSPVAPSMAVFTHGKPVPFEVPEIGQTQGWWKDAVRLTDVVVIVGVRPNPEDAHIWQPLADTKALVCAVGDEDAFRTWQRTERPANPFRFLGTRFDPSQAAIVAAL